MSRLRDARASVRVLAERRAHLAEIARVAPVSEGEVREHAALTFVLRLLRALYGEIDVLRGLDLSYCLAQSHASPQTPTHRKEENQRC